MADVVPTNTNRLQATSQQRVAFLQMQAAQTALDTQLIQPGQNPMVAQAQRIIQQGQLTQVSGASLSGLTQPDSKASGAGVIQTRTNQGFAGRSQSSASGSLPGTITPSPLPVSSPGIEPNDSGFSEADQTLDRGSTITPFNSLMGALSGDLTRRTWDLISAGDTLETPIARPARISVNGAIQPGTMGNLNVFLAQIDSPRILTMVAQNPDIAVFVDADGVERDVLESPSMIRQIVCEGRMRIQNVAKPAILAKAEGAFAFHVYDGSALLGSAIGLAGLLAAIRLKRALSKRSPLQTSFEITTLPSISCFPLTLKIEVGITFPTGPHQGWGKLVPVEVKISQEEFLALLRGGTMEKQLTVKESGASINIGKVTSRFGQRPEDGGGVIVTTIELNVTPAILGQLVQINARRLGPGEYEDWRRHMLRGIWYAESTGSFPAGTYVSAEVTVESQDDSQDESESFEQDP